MSRPAPRSISRCKSIAVPGSRTVPANRAKDLILVDFDETYEECWFSDPTCTSGNVGNVPSWAKNGANATNHWTTYGWSPIDHYQIAVGNYPGWRSPDQPGATFDGSNNIDECIWYNDNYGSCTASTPEYFLYSSMFDVGKAYGMHTAVIGGNDYPTGHINDNNVDDIQLDSGTRLQRRHARQRGRVVLQEPPEQPERRDHLLPHHVRRERLRRGHQPRYSGSLYQNATATNAQAFDQL